ILKEMQSLYARSVYNLLIAQHNRGAIELVSTNAQKLQSIKADTNEIKLRQFMAQHFELSVYFIKGEYDKLRNLVESIEKNLQKWSHEINKDEVVVFNYQLACFYIISGDNNKAFHYLNKVLHASNAETEFPVDIYCFAHLLKAIMHFEMMNMN